MRSIKQIVNLIRVRQWYKNLLVLTPLIFGDLLFSLNALSSVIIAFCIFCLVSSIIYILNDIKDTSKDRNHPFKKNRPLASGEVSVREALAILILLVVLAVFGLYTMEPLFVGVITLYIVQNVAYTMGLKNIPILDVITIGIGFVLRVFAGCVAAGVILSPWLFTAAFLLALLLGFSKRSFEKDIMPHAADHRPVLETYEPFVLQAFLIISSTAVIIIYTIYAITGAHTPFFVITIPFALYGILSFLSKSLISGYDPDDLIKDSSFIINLLLWSIVVVFLLYGL